MQKYRISYDTESSTYFIQRAKWFGLVWEPLDGNGQRRVGFIKSYPTQEKALSRVLGFLCGVDYEI